MKGYKVLEHDLRCHPRNWFSCNSKDEYDWYVKQYTIPGDFVEQVCPDVGRMGMHFCTKVAHLGYAKPLSYGCHVVEVEGVGACDIRDLEKSTWTGQTFKLMDAMISTNHLKIVRELTPQEVWDTFLDELVEWKRTYGKYVASSIANAFCSSACGYFRNVDGCNRETFEKRTGLTDTKWSTYLW